MDQMEAIMRAAPVIPVLVLDDPDAAVANLSRLLQEDRDRAIAALSDLRGETADLKTLPFTDRQDVSAEAT